MAKPHSASWPSTVRPDDKKSKRSGRVLFAGRGSVTHNLDVEMEQEHAYFVIQDTTGEQFYFADLVGAVNFADKSEADGFSVTVEICI